jgi:hypothetical protein
LTDKKTDGSLINVFQNQADCVKRARKMILPVNLKPYAKTYQHWAFPISAISAINKDAELHVINNLTHVFYVDPVEDLNFCDADLFNKWDCLDTIEITSNSVDSKSELEKFFLNKLDKGFYIYTLVNEKYIPHRKSYLKFDHTHDIFVHGYEDDCFTVLGYCDDRHYRSTTVPIKDFMSAWYNDFWIYFFKMRDHYVYKFDINKNIELISKYLLSIVGQINFARNIPCEIFYGVNAFYEFLRRNSQTNFVRDYDFFYEHKRLMYDRLCYFSRLIDMERIKTKYQEILQSASFVRNLAIKLEIEMAKSKTNTSTNDRIINRANQLLDKERRVLEEFLNIVGYIR